MKDWSKRKWRIVCPIGRPLSAQKAQKVKDFSKIQVLSFSI